MGFSKTVSTSSDELVPPRHNRKAIYVTNTGTSVVTISKGIATAVAGAGIVLQPTAVWYETDSQDFRAWRGQINVVASAAGSVAVEETLG